MKKIEQQTEQEKQITYKFGVLDPRPVPEAEAKNSELLGENTLGIEVSVPKLAEGCGLGNIDPQHSSETRFAGCANCGSAYDARTYNSCPTGCGGISTAPISGMAAIEIAERLRPLPPQGTRLVTIRPDLDSLGAMAVLEMRMLEEKHSIQSEETAKRIQKVAIADKFARGEWPGKKELPTKENPWPENGGGVEDSRELAAIAAAVVDFKITVDNRVRLGREWLKNENEPAQYRERVGKEREALIKAIESGEIKIDIVTGGKIALVESKHRAGTMLGYAQAPVVIALNPEFRFQGGEPHKKFTVSQFKEGYIDLKNAAQELNKKEQGWGGSPSIIVSPQGKGSELSKDEVLKTVEKYLT